MSYKDLLVHVDGSRACAKRIEAAIGLAAAHEAHLTAVCVRDEPPALAYATVDLPQEVLHALSREATERAKAALERFADAAGRAGIAYATRMDDGLDLGLAETLAVHARHADLIVLGQVDEDDPAVRHRGLPEEVALNAGRPALVVPYIGAGGIGERIMVAWNASREAARAIGDAMPLLERARAVTVVSVNARPDALGHGEEPGADIGVHLARHGVRVDVTRLEARDIDVPNAILSHLVDVGSDLLVMGCYGHSRLREMVLGGVTRTILREMTVPVLMAH